ncbi:MAG TPA: succinylglutamate desuccinylase/aspartoacylase family protein [Burkholderiaceae bacterium]|jgi:predicted deacylase
MTTHNAIAGMHFHSVSYTGLKPGPRVIITGAVHGNETCGTKAIHRVINQLDQHLLHIESGSITFVPITNPLAYARGQRMGDRNLNRNLYPTDSPVDFEDHVANWLCPLLGQHDVLLDLHSFHTQGQPFVMVGPDNNQGALEPFAHATEEKALARHLGVRRFVDGWLDTYAKGVARRVRDAHKSTMSNLLNTDARYGVGTTEYMRSVGGYGLTLECGQHNDPNAPEVGYRAILNTLSFLKMIDAPIPTPISNGESLHLCDVIDKIDDNDRFSREWASYDRLSAGDVIGTRHGGASITASYDGFIVFPNPNAVTGQEWFYLAKANPTL